MAKGDWQVANGGGVEALLIDAAGRALNKDYGRRVASHEAGHFLVAYLIGLLPKKYILSSLDAFRRCCMPPHPHLKQAEHIPPFPPSQEIMHLAC